jgi:hypothetical protein
LSAWFLKSSASNFGPYSASDLRKALRAGDLDPFSDVYHDSNPNLIKPIIEWDEIFSEHQDAEAPATKEPDIPVDSFRLQPLAKEPTSQKESSKLVVQYSQSEFKDDEKTTNSERRDKTFGYNSKEAIEEFNKKEIQRLAQDGKAPPVKSQPSAIKKAPRSAQKSSVPAPKAQRQEGAKGEESQISERSPQKNSSREYYVVIGLKRMGPFPSSKIVEGYQSGMLSENALVAHGSSDRKVPISRFVEVYVTGGGKKKGVVPTPPRKANSFPMWGIIGGLAAVLVIALVFWMTNRSNLSLQSVKPRADVKSMKDRALRTSSAKKPPQEAIKAPPVQIQPVQIQPAQVQPAQVQPAQVQPAPGALPTAKLFSKKGKSSSRVVAPSKNRLSTNRKSAPAPVSSPAPTMQLRARAAPANASIPSALAGRGDGSEVSVGGLAFDQAAVRNCHGSCQILFIDRSGNAIQVLFDAGSHRNTLLSKRGRVNISGFLTAGRKKIILKEVN